MCVGVYGTSIFCFVLYDQGSSHKQKITNFQNGLTNAFFSKKHDSVTKKIQGGRPLAPAQTGPDWG